LEPSREQPHVPGPSLWPAGLALGVVVLLVGIIFSTWLVALGAVVTVAFGVLWVRDLARAKGLAHAPDVEPERHGAEAPAAGPERERVPPPAAGTETYGRSAFLEISTLGLGGIIGGLVTVPSLGFMVLPAFLKQGVSQHDVGPLANYPQDEWVVTTFSARPEQGTVSRLTAFVRYNGLLEGQPSFTVLSNHCVHLGCPVQPNGPLGKKKEFEDVTLIETQPSGFGCPCHGGQYDTEGNRSAGPPVRALDRYSFSIRNGHLFLGKPFSVSHVESLGKNAKIHKWRRALPGVHVDGIESWIYPIQPPS
jgi:Rieske Fe-S protein